MAQRNQVISLFGLSPEQLIQQQQETRRAEIQAVDDPYRRTGMQIGQQLQGMFGGEPAEVTRQRELYSQLEGVNFENPEQMRAAAASLQNQFPDRALQLLSLAEQSEARQQTIAASQAQQALAERQANEVTRKYKVKVKVFEPLIPGGPAVEKTKEQIIDVKGTLNEDGKFNPYGGQLDFLQQQGADVSLVEDLPKVNAESVGIPNRQGVDIRREPDGGYVIVNDDERIVRKLTEEEVKSLGGKPPEPQKEELPIIKEKRQEVESKIESGRIKQSITNPSSTVFDPDNPTGGIL